MIDSGLKDPDRYGILALLEQEHIHVSALLASHYHRDHIGNHRVIKEKHGTRLYMSPFAADICSNPQKPSTFESSMLAIMRKTPRKFYADEVFDPKASTITAAGSCFELIALPGHAQEHTGFVTPDGVAYLGDTILSRDILHAIRIPYCTYCKEDLETKAMAADLNCSCYILAHNSVTGSIRELAYENIENMHDKINMVESFLGSYITLEDLTAKVMEHTHSDANSLVKVLGARRNVQVLIDFLQETGRLDMRAKDGYIEYIRTK
jgi:glyoxylase-like metal-dependent hydrolase (beta-lactamase superfamily II)